MERDSQNVESRSGEDKVKDINHIMGRKRHVEVQSQRWHKLEDAVAMPFVIWKAEVT